MTVILHVGAGKCGSSSLQTQLSSKPLLQADNGSALYEYICIQPNGDVLRGDALERAALRAPHDSQVSVGAEQPWGNEVGAIDRLSSQLKAVLAEGRTPIASCKSWLYQPEIFRANDLLTRLGVRAKIVVFVRPQILWLNSAWWQWGVWSSFNLEDWVESIKHSPSWAKLIGEWQSMPGVETVEVHLATGNVVSTFFRLIGVSIADVHRRNTSLDGNLLQYLRGRPELRVQLGTGIEFILEKWLAAEPNGTPWVLEQDQISRLIEYYRPDTRELLSLVSSEAREDMERDPMWWDPAAYSERKAVSANAAEPSVEALKNISDRAIDAVIRLDRRVRDLEMAQRDLSAALEAQHAQTLTAQAAAHDLSLALDAQRAETFTAQASERDLSLALDAQRTQTLTAQAAAHERFLALEAAKAKPLAPLLRKAVSINGIRRLVRV